MKSIPVINWVCACVKTSVEDDNFLREGWVCVNLVIFIYFESFLHFGLTEKALFQVILGLLLVYADWEKGGVCLRVCMCVCFMTSNYWDMFVVVRSNDSFNLPLGWIKYIVIVVIETLTCMHMCIFGRFRNPLNFDYGNFNVHALHMCIHTCVFTRFRVLP